MARVNCGGVSRLELRGPLLQDASTGCSPPPCAADRERAAAAVPGVIACRHVLQGLVRGEHLIPRTSTTMKRNPDRTWRNARHAIVVGNRIIVARWVTVEILRCKRTGLSMAAIAVHIGRVGQGYEQPLSPFPDGIEFPAEYRLSESAVFKAYHKAMNQQPAINAEVFRKEDT